MGSGSQLSLSQMLSLLILSVGLDTGLETLLTQLDSLVPDADHGPETELEFGRNWRWEAGRRYR